MTQGVHGRIWAGKSLRTEGRWTTPQNNRLQEHEQYLPSAADPFVAELFKLLFNIPLPIADDTSFADPLLRKLGTAPPAAAGIGL